MAEGQDNTRGGANAAPKTKKVVTYIGTADVREIDAASWKRVGADEQGKLTWDAKNGHQVDASELNAGALKYVENDAITDFKVEDVEV